MPRFARSMILLTMTLFVSLALLVAACSDDDSNADDDDAAPTSCEANADCEMGNLCNTNGLCEACAVTCETLRDCDVTTQICDATIGCCVSVGCSVDDDCEEPFHYCIDKTCRQKSCEDDSECTREGNQCLDGACQHPECTVYTECETKLCDLTTYTCTPCSLDSDCPKGAGLICSNGDCVTPGSDVDGDEDLLGCSEFQSSCLNSLFRCFGETHLDPPMDVQVGGCELICDGDTPIGLRYILIDGAAWETLSPAGDIPYSVAKSAQGEVCYYVEPDVNSLVYYIFYDADHNEVGRYQINEAEGFAETRCSDGTNSRYRYDALYQGASSHCPGFSRYVRYAPQAPVECPTSCP